MDMIGQRRISASRGIVWQALNDPKVLKISIPGCEELVRLSDTSMAATAVIKVGPVKAKFEGNVTFSELAPPNGYRITGEGKGGIAGFAKGSATVRLEEDGACTILQYDVSTEIGGKLSQLRGRLIDTTARQMAAAFFKKFSDEIARRNDAASASRDTSQIKARVESGLRLAPALKAPAASNCQIASVLVFCAALADFCYAFGAGLPSLLTADGGRLHVSADFASALLLIMSASIGYLLGRQTDAR